MGLKYKVVLSERKELDTVSCDRCTQPIKKIDTGHWNEYGELYTKYHGPMFECFFELNQTWGYSSGKDGQHHSAILCEPCYDQVFKDVKIKVNNYF